MHTSIHPSSFVPCGSWEVLEPMPADLGEMRGTPWTSCQSIVGPHWRQTIHPHIYTLGQFRATNPPMCMFLPVCAEQHDWVIIFLVWLWEHRWLAEISQFKMIWVWSSQYRGSVYIFLSFVHLYLNQAYNRWTLLHIFAASTPFAPSMDMFLRTKKGVIYFHITWVDWISSTVKHKFWLVEK